MPKIRVGFIGAGQIADLHARACENNPTGTLFAMADSSPCSYPIGRTTHRVPRIPSEESMELWLQYRLRVCRPGMKLRRDG
ncbi:MAG TPA: hypothetical protein EYQ61_11935 [Dehalococcoidia bacterium]|nr:hypothetical protein [Dehalococcoidia bacterium]